MFDWFLDDNETGIKSNSIVLANNIFSIIQDLFLIKKEK